LDAAALVDADLPNNDSDVGEEEHMFEQAKMYTDRGKRCFTTKEILSIRLLGIVRDIGAPLKTYRRFFALFKDVITEREAITTTFCHGHTAIVIIIIIITHRLLLKYEIEVPQRGFSSP
jgi:hypothetical protein